MIEGFALVGQATRIHDDDVALTDARHTVLPITRETGHVGDQRTPGVRQHIEKRGLAHVRAPYEGDYGCHRYLQPSGIAGQRGDTIHANAIRCRVDPLSLPLARARKSYRAISLFRVR